MSRGELYLANLSDTQGSEQAGIRPVVIVQNEVGNLHSPTTIICPLTSKVKTKIDTHVSVSPCDCDIIKESTILCEQVRVIDKTRLIRRLGEVHNQEKIQEINEKLMLSLGVLK